MLKYILFLQIAFTLACTHFAFANSGEANRDVYSRSADKQEIRAMPGRTEDSATCENNATGCERNTPDVKTDNGLQMIAGQDSDAARAPASTN